MKWKVATAIICCFGVFKDFRPSESYLTSYLTSADMKNLSVDDVNSQVYPVWTYSYLATLLLVLLITDYLRYKIVINVEAFAYIITWVLLLWGQGILQMQFMQVAYGFATSAEIAYYSYIYAAVSDVHYRKVSGLVRGSSLIGRFFAAVLGQILVISGVNYFKLNIISTVNVCIAFVISIFLPKIEKSFYFHKHVTNQIEDVTDIDYLKTQNTINGINNNQLNSSESSIHTTNDGGSSSNDYIKISFKNGLKKMANDFIKSYSRRDIFIWSFWWAMDSCGNLQLGNYIQNLWIEITPNRTHTNNYNGAVDAASMAFNFRPSESFITAYLMAPEWKNLTAEQVNNEVYPVWVYTNLVCLLVILLVTDWLRYKIIIVIAALCYVATWFLLLFGQGVPLMQLMQGTFSFATASQIAHTSYVFSSVDKKFFRKVSSYISSSSLVSRFFAACLAQLLVSFANTNYFILNVISTVSVCIAFIISLTLPTVTSSFYFTPNHKSRNRNDYNSKGNVNGEEEIQKLSCDNSKIDEDIISSGGIQSEIPKIPEHFSKEPDSVLFKPEIEKDSPDSLSVSKEVLECEASEIIINHMESKNLADTNTIQVLLKTGMRKMWKDFQKAYQNQGNLIWSYWWVVVVCGKTHIGNYIQSLYEDIVPNPASNMSYNAATDAVALSTCAAASFGIGFSNIQWNSYENVLLLSVNIIISGLMILMALATKIWLAYICYVLIRICYNTVLTIATYQIATFLDTQSYALVFGFNTFVALVLETILTIIVVDKRGLNLDIRTQFLVYGGYFGVLALPFFGRMFYCFFYKRRKKDLNQ